MKFLGTLIWAVCLSLGVSLGAELTMNNIKIEEGFEETAENWNFRYSTQFNDAANLPPELRLVKTQFKQHATLGHIKGYNGDIVIKLKTPGKIIELSMEAQLSNYADALKRKFALSYSLDGYNYELLDTKESAAGGVKLSGVVAVNKDSKFIYLKFSRILAEKDDTGKYGFVVFNQISFAVKGTLAPAVVATTAEAVDGVKKKDLKKIFPTGVFWPWERTKQNADIAGMDTWAFVEQVMKTLKDHGVDSLWFVNLPEPLMPKVLIMAETYGMRCFMNTDLVGTFYAGMPSLPEARMMAGNTVNRIGDFSSLYGYVLKDEPLICSVEQVSYFYQLMKEADPSRDALVVAMIRESPTLLDESPLPVVCSDPYMFGHNKSTNIPNPAAISQNRYTELIANFNQLADRNGKHSWTMGQMFGDVWGKQYRKGDKMVVYPGSYLHWRMPTEAETRWQIWEAVRLGSKGIFFYVLLSPGQITVPEDQVKPESREEKYYKSKEALAKIAANWKTQVLTQEITEVDPGEGVLEPGGKPTPQAGAMKEVFELLRRYEPMLAEKTQSRFPGFFATNAKIACNTFDLPNHKRLGVVVNHDVDESQTVTILVPRNTAKIVNLADGAELKIMDKDNNFNQVKLSLPPGGGAMLEAAYQNDIAGMPICRERFEQVEMNRLSLGKNAAITTIGNFNVRTRVLKLTGDPSLPVATLVNLTNGKSAVNTFAMNLNSKRENGTIFCRLEGNLTNAEIVAVVNPESAATATNVMHLAQDKNSVSDDKNGQAFIVQKEDFFIPVALPVGTTSVKFYLKNPGDYIKSINLWFVPAPK